MAVACIILVVIAVLGIGLAFYYRRQIKNVKNQISFLNQHETNMANGHILSVPSRAAGAP